MAMQVWSNPSDPKLGDYVRTHRFGNRGRVTAVHHSCPEKLAWCLQSCCRGKVYNQVES